jgi:serine/threonine protein kinase
MEKKIEASPPSQITWGSNVASYSSYYKIGKQIATGAFGVIYKGYDEINKIDVIMKVVQRGDAKIAVNEAEFLKKLKSPQIVEILNFFICGDCYFLVFEKMDADLHEHLHKLDRKLQPEQHKKVFSQILTGVKYLHDQSYAHRDLKPENLLMNSDFTIKICDLGAACKLKEKEEKVTEELQTRWYRAPELLLDSSTFTLAIDMWSLGCIFAEILGSRALFPGYDGFDQIKSIVEFLGTPTLAEWPGVSKLPFYQWIQEIRETIKKPWSSFFKEEVDPLALDLLSKLLIYDPRKRITVGEALNHDYFKS